jgi:HD-like signal output (HDOD) protein/CheY-like chemotaxis protein
MKQRILFVDDEPSVLAGLRRMLRHCRDEWETEFADSGQAALALMERAPSFDAIVTDMRMPGMDGAELLREVRTRWPSTLRFVLSGQTDQELALKAVGPAHQFLSKPCDSETLVGAIRRALQLRQHLATNQMSEIVARLDKLPSLPGTYRRLLDQVNSPEGSVEEIGRIITQDPAMTAKLLKLVNSSFFSFAQHVTNPTQAVLILGVNTIKALVLGAQVFAQLEPGIIEELHISDLQTHSLATAVFARRIVEVERGEREIADEAFLAGLLHDIGKLVLAANLPDEYRRTILSARRREVPISEVETEDLGATHAEIGAFLLGLWGFPVTVIEAVGLHHSPAIVTAPGFSTLVAVHAADVFEHEDHGQSLARLGLQLDMEIMERVGCTRRVEQWRAACGESRGAEVS